MGLDNKLRAHELENTEPNKCQECVRHIVAVLLSTLPPKHLSYQDYKENFKSTVESSALSAKVS